MDDKNLPSRLMDRLKDDALASKSEMRLRTLLRLQEACDDLLSGHAVKLAKEGNSDHAVFNPTFFRFNPALIEKYVKLRQRLEHPKLTWTGPVAVTIRADRNLTEYVKLRAAELKQPKKSRHLGPRSDRLEVALSKIESLTDKAELREALADGRKWKHELDLLRSAIRNLAPIDADWILANVNGSRQMSSTVSRQASTLGESDRNVMLKLVGRLQSDRLIEFGLTYRNGRLKMLDAPGTDLILPEEMSLLISLANLPN